MGESFVNYQLYLCESLNSPKTDNFKICLALTQSVIIIVWTSVIRNVSVVQSPSYRGAALTPGLPLAPVRTQPVVAGLRLLPVSLAQPARLSPRPVRLGSLAVPGPLSHSPATCPTAGAPAWPARPVAVPGVCRTHPLLLVTVHTRAVARSLRYVVHGTLPDIAAGPVVTH